MTVPTHVGLGKGSLQGLHPKEMPWCPSHKVPLSVMTGDCINHKASFFPLQPSQSYLLQKAEDISQVLKRAGREAPSWAGQSSSIVLYRYICSPRRSIREDTESCCWHWQSMPDPSLPWTRNSQCCLAEKRGGGGSCCWRQRCVQRSRWRMPVDSTQPGMVMTIRQWALAQRTPVCWGETCVTVSDITDSKSRRGKGTSCHSVLATLTPLFILI